jgi:hypothetical protein
MIDRCCAHEREPETETASWSVEGEDGVAVSRGHETTTAHENVTLRPPRLRSAACLCLVYVGRLDRAVRSGAAGPDPRIDHWFRGSMRPWPLGQATLSTGQRFRSGGPAAVLPSPARSAPVQQCQAAAFPCFSCYLARVKTTHGVSNTGAETRRENAKTKRQNNSA